MLFKTKKIESEYNELPVRNGRLFQVLRALEIYCRIEFNKDLVITHIYRTPEEHKQLYAMTKNPPTSSPHQFWEGVDLRSSTFTQPEIDKMVGFLNCFTFRNGKKTAIYHAIAGNVPHFHIQVAK